MHAYMCKRVLRFFNSNLLSLPGRFVSSLLEEPEVAVIGAGRGPAGSIIHKLFVSAQRVTAHTLAHLLTQELCLVLDSHEPGGLQVEERARGENPHLLIGSL